MWQHMFSMPVMRTAWRRELTPPHSTLMISLNPYIFFYFLLEYYVSFNLSDLWTLNEVCNHGENHDLAVNKYIFLEKGCA